MIGATNRPDMIDPAMLRPGRLDKLGTSNLSARILRAAPAWRCDVSCWPAVYVDLPSPAARKEILITHARHLTLAADVCLDTLAKDLRSVDTDHCLPGASLDAAVGAPSHPHPLLPPVTAEVMGTPVPTLLRSVARRDQPRCGAIWKYATCGSHNALRVYRVEPAHDVAACLPFLPLG